MLRLWLFLFIISLCFFTTLSLTTKSKEHLISSTNQEKILSNVNNDVETIAIYTPTRLHTKFTCLTLSAKTYVLQQKSKNATKLKHIPKGQKLCLNFPQDIPKTSLQITLKALEDKWLRVTIMGDSILLSGYIPLNAVKNGDKLQAKDMIESSSGGELLLNAPKITSNDIERISGTFSMQHILQIAKEKLDLKDYDSVKTWLALAQKQNPAELKIYEIYAALLKHEGKKEEALNLMQKLNEAKKNN